MEMPGGKCGKAAQGKGLTVKDAGAVTVQLVFTEDRRSFIPNAWPWEGAGTTWAPLCLMVNVLSLAPHGVSKRPRWL